MKTKLMAAAAAIAVMTAAGAARAETTDVAALKAQAAALKAQNEQLEQRLTKLEQQPAARPAASSFMAADLPVLKDLPPMCPPLSLDGPLTFCGITVFGTVDAGLGYASYGLPTNGKFYLGDNLISKNATHSYFGISPSNLAQSTIGIKGSTEILPGISGVFWASTGINPQSGQLANAPGSLVDQQGLNRNNFSNSGDGSRGGQAFNDQLYVGLASKTYGQLTFGRHKALTNDLVGAYDPAGGAYAFSVIGYSGTPVAGLGDTGNARWDNSFKYKVEYGLMRFGAIYKFADGNGGCNYNGVLLTGPKGTIQNCYSTQNDAGQVSVGFSYWGFDVDGVLGYFNQAVSVGALSSAQLLGASTFTSNTGTAITSTGLNSGTLTGTISDNTGWALAGKYTYNQWKFYAGWSHVIYHNPSNNVGIGGQNDQGGYQLSTVNNAAFPNAKLLDTVWLGTRYAYNEKTDIVGGFYMEHQNSYGTAANLATCSLPAYIAFSPYKPATYNQTSPRSGACSGNLYGASTFVDYHFTKRFDVYGGLMYSSVTGGLASGYFSASNWAPTVGARFTF
jgi:predicted porin